MKQKLDVSAGELVRIFERLDNVADILGITVNIHGISVSIKKGLGKTSEERYNVTYSVVRDSDGYTITFRPSGFIDPIMKLRIKSISKGCEMMSECLGDKRLCSYIEEMLKRLSKNIDDVLAKLRTNSMAKPEASLKFILSPKYAKVIDGLAEVTLSSLYLKYPLLDRRIVDINDVKDIENFLRKLYRIYGAKASEIYVHISTPSWMFVLAIDFANREYTPSFIENNIRFVGKEAINMFITKEDSYVTVTILTMQS